MFLQERTIVVRGFDEEKTTNRLLKELFIQAGPVRNIVLKPTHAFVEFEDADSVGYAKALLDGVMLFKRKLTLDPKERNPAYFRYTQCLKDYVEYDKRKRLEEHYRSFVENQNQPSSGRFTPPQATVQPQFPIQPVTYQSQQLHQPPQMHQYIAPMPQNNMVYNQAYLQNQFNQGQNHFQNQFDKQNSNNVNNRRGPNNNYNRQPQQRNWERRR